MMIRKDSGRVLFFLELSLKQHKRKADMAYRSRAHRHPAHPPPPRAPHLVALGPTDIPHTRRPRARPTSAGRKGSDSLVFLFPPSRPLQQLPGDYRFAREQDCDLRLFDFEAFGGFGKEVRSTLREAANQLSNKLSHTQHLDEVTWTTKNWHGLQMQRLSVVLHTAVAWQTDGERASVRGE